MAMADYREEDISSEESDDEEEIIKKTCKRKSVRVAMCIFYKPRHCRESDERNKCSHVLATAVRLKLTSWNPTFLDFPLKKKSTRGAKKKTKYALMRQSIESSHHVAPRVIEISSEEEDLLELVQPVPKKRGRPKLGTSLKKKKTEKKQKKT